MFSASIRRSIKNIPNVSNRTLCWIKNYDGLFSIGINQKTLDMFMEINYVEITRDNFVKNEHDLCFIKNNKFLETIKAPFDCKIIERNYNILETINTNPENENHSWIVRVEPIIWGQTWKIPLDETIDNYFNNYRNKTVDISLVN